MTHIREAVRPKLWVCAAFICLLSLWLSVPVFADDSRAYTFQLTADGETPLAAACGDTITVTVTLHRTAGTGPMYAMQDELVYDPAFFELVDGSLLVADGIETAEATLRDGRKTLYINFLSSSGGAEWADTVTLGVFRLRVLAASGTSAVENHAARVSTADGMDSYTVATDDLTVVVTETCLVQFDSGGGTEIAPRQVMRGQRLTAPEMPARDGFVFTGWFRDYDLTEPWDFSRDTVSANMTLYAGWQEELPSTAGGGGWWATAMAVVLLVMLLRWRRKQQHIK